MLRIKPADRIVTAMFRFARSCPNTHPGRRQWAGVQAQAQQLGGVRGVGGHLPVGPQRELRQLGQQ